MSEARGRHVAPVRERRGTTPLARTMCTPLNSWAITGPPVRFYWACQLFFRRLPGDGRISADALILVSGANRSETPYPDVTSISASGNCSESSSTV